MRTQNPRTLQAKGLAMLLVLAALVWLSIAVFDKRFTSSVEVTVSSQRAGLQLNENGDVRMRGALIGRIAEVEHRGGQAVVHLELDPEAARHVPANALARMLPTTLFGQKYVELVAPNAPSAAVIQEGAVIPEDRTSQAVELSHVLNNLGPLLTAVRPQDLSTTLQAIADGLKGRGDQLGQTVSAANHFLSVFNAKLPTLIEDLDLLADVSHTYAAAAPDLFALLDNASVTGATIVDRRQALARFTANVTELSKAAARFLDRNGDGLVEVTRLTAPVVRMLARYSASFPCLLRGLTIGEDRLNGAFKDDVFQLTVVLGLNHPGYTAADSPTNGVDTGAQCAGLPTITGPLTVPEFSDGAHWAPGNLLPIGGR